MFLKEDESIFIMAGQEFDRTQLATLAAVVRHGSFESAALALHVTPSAVSQRIKALEQSAGQVLVRRARPTAATGAGVVLVRLAGEIELLEREARRDLGGEGPVTVALAVNADSLSTWFGAVLAGLPDGVLVDVHRADQDVTADLLRDGTVMAAVTADGSAVQGCSVQRLGAMRYLAVATPDFRDRALGGPEGGRWGRAPLVAFDRQDTLQDRFLAGLGVRDRPPRHHVATQEAFLALVGSGRAWGMVPEASVSADLTAGTLVDAAPGRWLDVPLHWQRWKVDAPVLAELTALVQGAARLVLREPG